MGACSNLGTVTDTPPSSWHIGEGIRNAERFFRVLPQLFPDATLFIAEGSSISNEVGTFYRRHAPPDPTRPADLSALTMAPRYLCACTPEFFLELARLAAKTPRLYSGARQLIYWHDAFANDLILSPELPEATVAALAKKFGVRHRRARAG